MSGVFLILLGTLLSISLLTYDPTDSSFSTINTSPVVQNWIGKVGAFSADIFFQIMGISAYFLPVGLIFLGFSFSQERAPEEKQNLKKIGWPVLLLLLSAWAELLFAGSDAPNFKGGTIGFSINQFLIEYFALTGTYLLLFFFSILGVMLVAPFSPADIVLNVSPHILQCLQWIKEHIRSFAQKIPHQKTVVEDLHDTGEETETGKEETDAEWDSPLAGDVPLAGNVSLEEHADFRQSFPADDNGNGRNTAREMEEEGAYQLPPLSLLSDPPIYLKKVSPEELAAQAQILKRKLSDFGVLGEVKEIHPGPVVTLFEFEPAAGVKLNKITTLSDDLALAMRALQVRIVPRIPGKSVVGIEIPNRMREEVFLKEILSSSSFARLSSKLRLSLGKDIFGTPVAADLSAMPHLLIAGSTGSGKSVGLNSMILSILLSAKPTEVKLLLIDPKMIELSLYEEIPHLIAPVITDPKIASSALRRMVMEMQRRYELLAEMGVRNISAYNNLFANGAIVTRPPKTQFLFDQMAQDSSVPVIPLPPLVPLPYIVVCIDELADLMVVASRDVEESIGRLAQMARAAGIHLILATQRPSVDVLTGVIKANFPARIAFAVTSKIDSRTVLDTNGADQLLGKGDMLYMSAGTSKLLRIHGAYVSEEEVKRVVTFLKEQGKPHYEPIFSTVSEEASSQDKQDINARDELYEKARDLVMTTGQASASFIQRRMRVGYPRAARMIELMEEDGVVGPATGSKPRELLMKRNPNVHTHDAFTD